MDLPDGPCVVLQGWAEGFVSHLAALNVVHLHPGQVLGGHLQSKCLCRAPCPRELEEPAGLVKWGLQPAPARIHSAIVLSSVLPEMK